MLYKSISLSTIIVLTTALTLIYATTINAASLAASSTSEEWATSAKQKNERQEHRVGPLPWAAGQEPIQESYADNFPIRQWITKDGTKGDAEIWLQGGPGGSSMIGLFYETGPIHVTEDLKLTRNPNIWANEYSMLFIEQPVGTGYSFVDQSTAGSKPRENAGGNDDDDGGDDTSGFDYFSNDEEKGEDGGRRFEELDAELERDQQEEAAFFATLPSAQSFKFKAAAAAAANKRSTVQASNSMIAKMPKQTLESLCLKGFNEPENNKLGRAIQRHSQTLSRVELHQCFRVGAESIQAILFTCPGLQVSLASEGHPGQCQISLGALIQQAWASVNIQHVRLFIDVDYIDIPMSKPRFEFTVAEEQQAVLFEKLYRQIGCQTELTSLDLRVPVKRFESPMMFSSPQRRQTSGMLPQYWIHTFPGLLTLGDDTPTGRWGCLRYLAGLRKLETIRGLFCADDVMAGHILQPRNVDWIAQFWPRLKTIKNYAEAMR
ncbi:hypothetical protein BGX33_004521 [Mortierella sp. NVP41]|nr:hypothetical protein BGX33_004521 [Mortierella sp. NVP41]